MTIVAVGHPKQGFALPRIVGKILLWSCKVHGFESHPSNMSVIGFTNSGSFVLTDIGIRVKPNK